MLPYKCTYGTITKYIEKDEIYKQIRDPNQYNKRFSDPHNGHVKHLSVHLPLPPSPYRDDIMKKQQQPIQTSTVIRFKEGTLYELNECPTNPRFHIVYFINMCLHTKSMVLMNQQWQDVKQIGILNKVTSSVTIVACIHTNTDKEQIEQFKKEWESMYRYIDWRLYVYTENTHEYRGIYHLWLKSQEISQIKDVMIYFHSKGITRYRPGCRDVYEKKVFEITFQHWRHIHNIFSHVSSIQKAGCTISKEGWIWHNFMYVRVAYVRDVEQPIQTERRHYYEDWICRHLHPHLRHLRFCPNIEAKNQVERLISNEFYDTLDSTNHICTSLLTTQKEHWHVGRVVDPSQALSGTVSF